MSDRSASFASCWLVAAVSCSWVCGCERAPAPTVSTTQPRATTAPASARPMSDAPPPPVATAPAPTSSSAPASRPADRVPDYLDVVSRGDERTPAQAKAETKPGNVLVLTTENLTRLRLRSEDLPFEPGGSVFLRIDGKVIEWLRKSPTIELERTPNGEWITPAPVGRP